MELTFKVEGVNELANRLLDLGVNKVPVFVARALTTLSEQVQDGLITHTTLRLTVRGNWLTKGYKFGINRIKATKRTMEAEVYTAAPWLYAQETHDEALPRDGGEHLALPLKVLRWSRLDPKKIPKRLRPAVAKNAFKITRQDGVEIIYRRMGRGKRGKIQALYMLEPKVPIPHRIELVDTAQHYIDRTWKDAMDSAVAYAILDAGLGR